MKIKFLIATALSIGLFASTASAWEVENLNKQVAETNFVVGGGCSGTLISKEYRLILTAYHCISKYVSSEFKDVIGDDGSIESTKFEKLKRVSVSQVDYHDFDEVGSLSYETNIVARSKESDLAILQLVGDNLRSSMAAPILQKGSKILRGQPVIAVGNPRGLDASVTGGIISSVTRKINWVGGPTPMIQFDAMAAPGSSGGALYDNDGIQIGVVVGGKAGEFALAIPLYELWPLLDDNCFASIYDKTADDELCRNPMEDEGDDD